MNGRKSLGIRASQIDSLKPTLFINLSYTQP
jgi:hypothetical protein